jgi:hypothetical protein
VKTVYVAPDAHCAWGGCGHPMHQHGGAKATDGRLPCQECDCPHYLSANKQPPLQEPKTKPRRRRLRPDKQQEFFTSAPQDE